MEFEDLGWKGSFKRYTGLKLGLEDLFGRSVDLVEPSAVTNPYFKEVAYKHRALVYAACVIETPPRYAGCGYRDRQLRRAAERGFEIIGEALSALRKIDPATAESITDWQAIIAFRYVLIHGYGHVDHAKTWDILQAELPTLRRELDELLSS